MSHFSLMVLTDYAPDDKALARILAPWDENRKVQPYFKTVEGRNLELMANHYGLAPDDLEGLMLKMKDWEGGEGEIRRGWPDKPDVLGYKSTYNPDSKWDWYQVGGRWTGRLQPDGYDPASNPANIEDPCALCGGTGHRADEFLTGTCNGCGGEGKRLKWPTQWARYQGDQIQVKDLKPDFKPTFAVVKDGKWHEKGQMGWFGSSRDNMTDDEWEMEFVKMLSTLLPETWLTLVDCHI